MSRAIDESGREGKRGRVLYTLWRIIVTAAFAACVMFIWHNSMESADTSSGRSGKVLEVVNEILEPVGHNVITEHFIRKLAHFLEYAVEGALTVLLFAAYRLRFRKVHLAMLAVGLATAVIDESIQFFSPGRAPGILDVCIDMLGFLCGAAFVAAVCTVRNLRAGRRAVDA